MEPEDFDNNDEYLRAYCNRKYAEDNEDNEASARENTGVDPEDRQDETNRANRPVT